MRLQRWLFVLTVLEPQLTMKRQSGTDIGSAPSRPRPSVYSYPATPADAQMVRSSFEAPSRWKNRRSRLLVWSLPMLLYGRIDCGPAGEFARAENRSAIAASAAFQLIRSNRPVPFRPTRRSG